MGEASRGEWEEWTGKALHVRRRVSEPEEQVLGPALDIRGDRAEVSRRLEAVAFWLPKGWSE